MTHDKFRQDTEEGEILILDRLQALSPAPYLSLPLIKLMLEFAGVKDEQEMSLWQDPSFLALRSYFNPMNGIGVSDEEEFYAAHEERMGLHARLREEKPDLFRRQHYLLFRIASGLGVRYTDQVMPNYLRTTVGMAYHASYVHEAAGVVHYRAVLDLHKLDPHPESRALSHTGLVWLTSKLLKEQKEFGLFENEPVTDELLQVAQALP